MQKTVTIAGKEHTFATISVDQAEQAQLGTKNGIGFNKQLVLLSLQAGGDKTTTVHDIGALSYFNDAPNAFAAFLAPTFEVNGLKPPTAGESQPAGPAVEESISSTSTDLSAAGTATK